MTQSYCRLLLATPTCIDGGELLPVLTAAIAAGDIASLLIRHEDGDQLKKLAEILTPVAQRADIAVLIENDCAVAANCGADGVQVSGDLATYKAARAQLGGDAIVGVSCGTDRHRAMSVAEEGADYVGFDFESPAGGDEPIAQWWARVFEVPCVLFGVLSNQAAQQAIAKRVDFICPGDELWTSPDQAGDMVAAYNAMIKETQIETVDV